MAQLAVAPFRVSQEEIENLIGLRDQIEAITRAYNNDAAEMLERVMAGADVDPGKRSLRVKRNVSGAGYTIELEVS